MATADSKIKLNNSLTLRALVVLRDRTLFFNIIYIFLRWHQSSLWRSTR